MSSANSGPSESAGYWSSAPASLRKQWALELSEKFNLPSRVLDAKTYRDELRLGRAPLNEKCVLIVSFNYASALREEIKAIAWDLVVIDEAHKLRNAYRPNMGLGGITPAQKLKQQLAA